MTNNTQEDKEFSWEIDDQFDFYLYKTLKKDRMSEAQLREIRLAFFAGFSQGLMILRDGIPEANLDGNEKFEVLHEQLALFWAQQQ